jgi:peroxiredoxin Q/BCP
MKMGTTYSQIRLLLSLMLATLLTGGTIAAAVDIGEPAPEFTLLSTTGHTISLSEFKDKKHVLIQFYTADFNPV